jgi:outer membrane protein TolC
MHGSRTLWPRLLGSLAAPALLALACGARAEDRPDLLPAPADSAALPAEAGEPLATAVPVVPQTLDLLACRQIALEKQPAIAAARASLAAASARAQALDNLRVPTFLARDLPTRRQQAALGVAVAEAGVTLAQMNTVYGVDYGYLTALYARSQEKLTDQAVTSLNDLRDLIRETVKAGKRADVSQVDVDKVTAYISATRARREEAAAGSLRALSALREAVGVGPDYPVQLAHAELFDLKTPVDREAILAAAVAHRPELAQAALGVEVTGLEVCAQEARAIHVRVPTYASGSDIHAQPLPAGRYDTEYRPAAVGPEMPPVFTGSRDDRAEMARIYTGRAGAVADKTRGLILLEAEQAYLRWSQASRQLAQLDRAARDAETYFKGVRERFSPTAPRVSVDRLLEAAVVSTRLRAQANEARYNLLLALASLERVTAGSFHAGFESSSPVTSTEKQDRQTDKQPQRQPGNGAGRN